jgi:L-ascorbate metabolism protein UlaG (beta-lactamase superfamily)
MSTNLKYLKPNALVEPLFNQWYAWSHLIPPATAAMYMRNSHLKVMKSFIANPQMHITALKDPAMISGPFMSYGLDDLNDIRALAQETESRQAALLKLAEAIQELDQTLGEEARGDSLEPFYKRVPEELRGYVELVYDMNNHPSVRFIEGLLYQSPYYDESAQSVAMSLVNKDERPFVLNTPRLERGGQLHLKVPFRSETLDELFRMRQTAGSYEHVKDALGVSPEREALFSSFFTEECPPPPPKFEGEGVRVRYFGHACILVETKGVSVLCDPLISYKYASDISRYTIADLPERIDYVLITHYHQDHLMLEMLLHLRHRIGHLVVPRSSAQGLVDPSLKYLLQVIGFRNVIELDEMESIEVLGGQVTAVPFLGEHADLNIRTKTAYRLDLEGRRILCMADSNNVEPRLYDHLREENRKVDAVFIGMECEGAPLSWVYGPFLTKPLTRKMDQSRRLNGSDCQKGIDIVERVRAERVYIYAMGQEPWLSFVMGLQYTETSRPIVESDMLVAACREKGMEAERLLYSKEIRL